MRRNISYHDLCCPKGQVKMKLTILTSGYSLMGTYTFSERFIVAPHASGNTRGSDFFPLIWKRFPLTLPISEKCKVKKHLWIVSYATEQVDSNTTNYYIPNCVFLLIKISTFNIFKILFDSVHFTFRIIVISGTC